MKKWMCLLLVTVMLLGSGALAEEPSVLERFDFTCAMEDGTQFTLADHLGEVVFMNFWATWCGPCVYELPGIAQLCERYSTVDDVTTITINCGDRLSVVQAFLAEKDYTLPVVCDETNAVSMLYGFDAIPATVIFNKDGSVYGAWLGVQADVEEICEHYAGMIEAIR